MPTYILYEDPEQLQRGGLKQAGPVCFKRGFMKDGVLPHLQRCPPLKKRHSQKLY